MSDISGILSLLFTRSGNVLKLYPDDRALSRLALQTDVCVMQRDNMFDNGKSESGASGLL